MQMTIDNSGNQSIMTNLFESFSSTACDGL